MNGQVHPLEDAQRNAVDPHESVWLSASAGTGKTQILASRVLRLLLRPDCQPSDILCLTFTKAGATEMAVRVNQTLARWVRLEDTKLANELDFLGAPIDRETRERARSLFASVLDCPGGGLRIDTIHAFAQYLLSNFPEEASLAPGSRAMEDRDRDLLEERVLTDLLSDAARQEDRGTIAAIEAFSLRSGPDAVRAWLRRCAQHISLFTGPAAWTPPMNDRARRLLGLSADCDLPSLARDCADDRFPVEALRAILAIAQDWNTKTGDKMAQFVRSWLAAENMERLADIDAFLGTIVTKTGTPLANLVKRDPGYAPLAETVIAAVTAIRERRVLLELADMLASALGLGRAFALRWDEAKAREGLIDFDDQIRRAAGLLQTSDMALWIRYKLDRQFDHVLIDEAQDTNADQWAIVFALIDDFFDGLSAESTRDRTIFTVGDYKQAIFGFQGTSPRNFRRARDQVRDRMAETAEAALAVRGNPQPRYLQEYGLRQSFRTASPILAFVDKAIATIGSERFGLELPSEPHLGEDRPGLVTLWNTVSPQAAGDDDNGADSEAEDGAQETWIARHDRQMADKLAEQVARWLKEGFPLSKGGPRKASAGDIMILVRKRRELASLIVARLHAHRVPVAGVDRLRLGNPLAVKDLMAALRFAAQPLDDLNLANLLVSPLGGWTQQDLLERGYRDKNIPLWDHIRRNVAHELAPTQTFLRELLSRADYDKPQSLLRWLLVGPGKGRQKLVSRLGQEANDPIDELLNAAHQYAAEHTSSLQGFIRWFDAGDGELKREAEAAGDQVRVMTVHGAKGLQAKIVILADAAGSPSKPGPLTMAEPVPGQDGINAVPLPPLSSEFKIGPVAVAEEAARQQEMEEHWRLLYVAMTRAEEALFIGGSLTPSEKGVAHPDSWFARLKPLFPGSAMDDPIWGGRWEFGTMSPPVEVRHGTEKEHYAPLPDWLMQAPTAEPRPPRPLAPSRLADVEPADPPVRSQEALDARRRGTLIHALLERLPETPSMQRATAGHAWLERHASDLSEETRDDILAAAARVLEEPVFTNLFGQSSLAEVPLAAVVQGEVITGIVDRLVVTRDEVTVLDYKTTRFVPGTSAAIPAGTLKQMAAYRLALQTIYPGRRIRAAVLYTHSTQFFELADELLDQVKPGLRAD